MKYISLLLIVLLVFASCCGVKQAKTNSTTKIAKVETPPEPIKEIETNVEIINIENPKPITETPVEEKIIDPVENTKQNSISKIQTKPTEAFNHDVWNNLLQKYVTTNGKVDYKGFKSNRTALRNYLTSLSENTPTNTWSKEDKLAYWMNAYNAMTVDLIVRNYPVKSIKDIDKPWEQRLWKLKNKWYNLNEIEHHILRKMKEPRIHFGIVCASYSCPKLINQAFSASSVYEQLNKATKDFLADTKRNNISTNSIKISKIFSWFSKDFKQNGSLIDFLNTYSDIKISKNAKKSFKEYIWTLNE